MQSNFRDESRQLIFISFEVAGLLLLLLFSATELLLYQSQIQLDGARNSHRLLLPATNPAAAAAAICLSFFLLAIQLYLGERKKERDRELKLSNQLFEITRDL